MAICLLLVTSATHPSKGKRQASAPEPSVDTGSPFFLASALSCAMSLMLEGLALELRVASGDSCL